MNTQSFALEAAEILAADLADLFRPCADLVEVVGSVRRRHRRVKDVELVMLSRSVDDPSKAGSQCSAQWLLVNKMLEDGIVEKRPDARGRMHFGQKSQRLLLGELPVDLFITVDSDCYGLLKLLRTGPYEFSRLCVTQKRKGGWLADAFRVEDGRVWKGDEPMPARSEPEAWSYLTIPYVDPEMRGEFGKKFLEEWHTQNARRRTRS